MRNKIITLALSGFLLITASLSGCGVKSTTTPAGSSVFFAQLAANPGKYNGQTVTFEGYYFSGFEIAVLCENLIPEEGWAGNYMPDGIKIWATGSFPDAVKSKLYVQPNNPTAYPAYYGKVQATGTLSHGGKYGHMDAYQYQITIADIKLLDWKP